MQASHSLEQKPINNNKRIYNVWPLQWGFHKNSFEFGKREQISTQPSSRYVLSKLLMSKLFHLPVKYSTWETVKNAMCILSVKLSFENKIQEIYRCEARTDKFQLSHFRTSNYIRPYILNYYYYS